MMLASTMVHLTSSPNYWEARYYAQESQEIPAARRPRRDWLPWAIAGAAVLLAAAAFAWPYFRRSPPGEVTEATRFIIAMPDKTLILGPPVMPSLPQTPERQQINVILNWPADLKK
jgi:hypothetical protein